MAKDFYDDIKKEFTRKFNEEANSKFGEEFNKKVNEEFNKDFNNKFNKDFNKIFNSKVNENINKEINEKINKRIAIDGKKYDFNSNVKYPFDKEFTKEFSKDFNEEFNKRFNEEVETKINYPSDLEEVFNLSMERSKRKLVLKDLIKTSKIIIASIVLLCLTLNISPSFSAFASDIPFIGKISTMLIFDKGIKNALDKGLYQEINYSETKNGITLKINNLVGDNNAMIVEYSVDGVDNIANKDVHLIITDKEYNPLSSITQNEKNSAFKINFLEFQSEFLMLVNVYDSKDGKYENELAAFSVPIELNENLIDLYKGLYKEIEFDKELIESEVGKIGINSLTTSPTTTTLEFDFFSDEYDFMGFSNPRLFDENGEVYHRLNDYYEVKDGSFNLRFVGDLSENKSIVFYSDGIYFARKDNRIIRINIEDMIVEENYYGISIWPEERKMEIGLMSTESNLTLSAEGLGYFDFKENDDFLYLTSKWSTYEISEIDGEYIYFYDDYEDFIKNANSHMKLNLLTDKKIIELELERVQKDKTNPIEFKIK